jgi:hypothetical protein
MWYLDFGEAAAVGADVTSLCRAKNSAARASSLASTAATVPVRRGLSECGHPVQRHRCRICPLWTCGSRRAVIMCEQVRRYLIEIFTEMIVTVSCE